MVPPAEVPLLPVAGALARHPLEGDGVDQGGRAAGEERVLVQAGVEEGEGRRRLEVLLGRQGGVREADLAAALGLLAQQGGEVLVRPEPLAQVQHGEPRGVPEFVAEEPA